MARDAGKRGKVTEDRTKAALAVLGTMSEASAMRLEETVTALRKSWRRIVAGYPARPP